jgi:DNA primase
MTPEAAAALVDEAAARLFAPEGAEALGYLHDRGLEDETICTARLGYAPRVQPVTRDGRPYTACGIVLPWWNGNRLALVKLRQPEGCRPKYAEVFHDRDRPPTIFPQPDAIRPGRPLILTEGEFDCLVLMQALGDLASIATLGSASAKPDPGIVWRLMSATPWFVALDADEAGDRSAAEWNAYPRARRVRPPEGAKDWTDLHLQAHNAIRYHWLPLLGWTPPSRNDLAGWRWGPGESDEPADDEYERAERAAIMAESDEP